MHLGLSAETYRIHCMAEGLSGFHACCRYIRIPPTQASNPNRSARRPVNLRRTRRAPGRSATACAARPKTAIEHSGGKMTDAQCTEACVKAGAKDVFTQAERSTPLPTRTTKTSP